MSLTHQGDMALVRNLPGFRRWPVSIFLMAMIQLGVSTAESQTQHQNSECVPISPIGLRVAKNKIPSRFQVVSWNIEKGADSRWYGEPVINAEAPEILLLQEASPDLPAMGSLTTQYDVVFGEGYVSESLRTGVMTLSSSDIIDGCYVQATEPWLGTPKATLISKHPLEGCSEALLAVNLHGVNFSWGAEVLAEQIEIAMELISAHDGPVVLGGDFNTWRAGRMRLLEDAAKQLGLIEVPFEPDARTRFLGNAVDHLYFRDLKLIQSNSIETGLSDHNPISATLETLCAQVSSEP